MAPVDRSSLLDAPVISSDAVADLFDVLARERAWMEQELDEIYGGRLVLERATVGRLVALGRRLEPAVLIRERLSATDPATLQAGIALWLARQPAPQGTGSTR